MSRAVSASNILIYNDKFLEARAGIEPACKDLQSSASPLRHRASQVVKERSPSGSVAFMQWGERKSCRIL
jgi:hypothetical protein